MKDFLKFGCVSLVAFVLMLCASETLPPANAIVVVDTEKGTYSSLPCARLGHTMRDVFRDVATPMQYAEVRTFGDILAQSRKQALRLDPVCGSTGGVNQRTYQVLFVGRRWDGSDNWRW
jgi:hypothetical protein